MKKLAYNRGQRKGITLTEILMAVGFLAMAFIPIMALLSSSLTITDKDQANIIAMNLCQEKLNTALQFKFGHFNSWMGSEVTNTDTKDGNLVLDLKDTEINSIPFTFHFQVTDRPGVFTLMSRDFESETVSEEHNPANWKFEESPTTINYKNLVHRYKMTVKWQDRGKAGMSGTIKDYSLVTFKADINR